MQLTQHFLAPSPAPPGHETRIRAIVCAFLLFFMGSCLCFVEKYILYTYNINIYITMAVMMVVVGSNWSQLVRTVLQLRPVETGW
jgi:hypothetical protein